ncbi:bifunctional diguanylate cyclase/phosphodiesterase [Ectothiorhodospiraceae bacterium BW-2]|nr:bifunctional diguanylate cyclase/phosphodiesterase [Ectothiorhodospiraceae bacterium BW-2]
MTLSDQQRFVAIFILFIAAAHTLPPLFGSLSLNYLQLVDSATVAQIMESNLFRGGVLAIVVFNLLYFYQRFAHPLGEILHTRLSQSQQLERLTRLRRFSLEFWLLFILSSALRSSLFMAIGASQQAELFSLEICLQISTIAVIVTITLGLPIFLLLSDHLGKLAPQIYKITTVISIQNKGLLLGALMPLLLTLMLLLYYYSRTQFFELETLGLILLLGLLALLASYTFIRSFRLSLSPLKEVIEHKSRSFEVLARQLQPRSLDELGVLTWEYRRLMQFHHQAQQQIVASERELTKILDSISEFFFVLDHQGCVTQITSAVEATLGYRPAELRQQPFTSLLIHPDNYSKLLQTLAQSADQSHHNYQCQMRRRDGSSVYLAMTARLIGDERPETLLEGSARDITNLVKAQEALQEEQQKALITLNAINDGVVSLRCDGTIEYANQIAQHLSGSTQSLLDRPFTDTFHIMQQQSGKLLCFETILAHIFKHEQEEEIRCTLTPKESEALILDISVGTLYDSEANIRSVVLVLHDVTNTVALAQELSFQAAHDQLTGLKNRREFEQRLEKIITDAHQHQHHHALLYLDLDQFKVVNDTCGHQAGDELLKQLTYQLQPTIRTSDTLARLGGDEFGIILHQCSIEKALTLGDKIRQMVSDFRFHWDNKTFEIGASIGLVSIDSTTTNSHDLMRCADSACYQAKDLGRNRVYLYQEDDTSLQQKHGEMSWVHRISAALSDNRFILYAQEIRSLRCQDEPPHYEILVRMCETDGSTTPPMAFIPAAERYNMMVRIDQWIINQTLTQLSEVLDEEGRTPIICSINLSGQSLSDEQLLDYVTEKLQHSGVPANSLCFEITETSAITHLSKAMELFTHLREMGCSFSLDDFGSGLSSFGYLKQLPIDCLKIDGSFIRDILDDPIDRQMVDSINKIGHIMNLHTIAEFVENDASISLLKELDIDYVQGYGVSRPVPLEEVLARYRPPSPTQPTP